ncbi:hypothetical protein LINPERPRIM_LOCUS14965, partial [Linum perenne]
LLPFTLKFSAKIPQVFGENSRRNRLSSTKRSFRQKLQVFAENPKVRKSQEKQPSIQVIYTQVFGENSAGFWRKLKAKSGGIRVKYKYLTGGPIAEILQNTNYFQNSHEFWRRV